MAHKSFDEGGGVRILKAGVEDAGTPVVLGSGTFTAWEEDGVGRTR
jgi:hypothetical protein